RHSGPTQRQSELGDIRYGSSWRYGAMCRRCRSVRYPSESGMLRVRTGRLKNSGTEFAVGGASVSACLKDIEGLLQDLSEPGLRLHVQVPTDLPMVRCD